VVDHIRAERGRIGAAAFHQFAIAIALAGLGALSLGVAQ
jgi:hypothetical protein